MHESKFNKIEQFQKETTAQKTNPTKIRKKLNLEEYFKHTFTKSERNDAIMKALKDGFMQSEITKYLNMSDAGGVAR